jgi:hypothetical protein
MTMILFQDPMALPDGVRNRTVAIRVNHDPLDFDATLSQQQALDEAGKESVQKFAQQLYQARISEMMTQECCFLTQYTTKTRSEKHRPGMLGIERAVYEPETRTQRRHSV